MNESIDEAYFNWLCAKVLMPGDTNYQDLLRILHQTEFSWLITGDKNRTEDGVELRYHFLTQTGWKKDQAWYEIPCSVFEILISFADRASFQTDTPVLDWFWVFISNLRLDDFRQVSVVDLSEIDDILYNFIWRTYDEHGRGGLFPLDEPKEDQRQVEIWYQFCAWVDEKALI